MPNARWSPARARAWHTAQPWRVGCNFAPSTAANQLEMWQAETFDPETIDRELGWAAETLGMNAARVYLHDLLWVDDADGFLGRVDRFLEIAHGHGIAVMLVFFDDCWHDAPRLGPQGAPVPGVHNSRWAMSPGGAAVEDRAAWPRLEAYVRGVVRRFGQDDRVLAWDLYNEVGNRFMPAMNAPAWRRVPGHLATLWCHVLRRSPSLDLMDAAFGWARAERPAQPLTAPVYYPFPKINRACLAQSDVVTFHNYEGVRALERQIAALKAESRPVLCTEWLSRTAGSLAETHLPVFRRERVGCFCWGLVAGKTQTIYSWEEVGQGEPDVWFHDLLRPDGTPYDAAEAAFFRRVTPRAPEVPHSA